MQLCTGTSGNELLPNVATIGFFDGVHRGHRFLIEQVCKVAAERGLASSVITFPVHPRKVMQPDFRPDIQTGKSIRNYRLWFRESVSACRYRDRLLHHARFYT